MTTIFRDKAEGVFKQKFLEKLCLIENTRGTGKHNPCNYGHLKSTLMHGIGYNYSWQSEKVVEFQIFCQICFVCSYLLYISFPALAAQGPQIYFFVESRMSETCSARNEMCCVSVCANTNTHVQHIGLYSIYLHICVFHRQNMCMGFI
jgi:hypothetical protein